MEKDTSNTEHDQSNRFLFEILPLEIIFYILSYIDKNALEKTLRALIRTSKLIRERLLTSQLPMTVEMRAKVIIYNEFVQRNNFNSTNLTATVALPPLTQTPIQYLPIVIDCNEKLPKELKQALLYLLLMSNKATANILYAYRIDKLKASVKALITTQAMHRIRSIREGKEAGRHDHLLKLPYTIVNCVDINKYQSSDPENEISKKFYAEMDDNEEKKVNDLIAKMKPSGKKGLSYFTSITGVFNMASKRNKDKIAEHLFSIMDDFSDISTDAEDENSQYMDIVLKSVNVCSSNIALKALNMYLMYIRNLSFRVSDTYNNDPEGSPL